MDILRIKSTNVSESSNYIQQHLWYDYFRGKMNSAAGTAADWNKKGRIAEW